MNTVQQVNKICHFTLTVSPHYLVQLKRHKQHILKSIITVRSIEPVVRNFRRKSSSVRVFQFLVGNYFISLLAEKKFTFSRFFLLFYKIGLASNSAYLILRTNSGPMQVRAYMR